MAETVAVTAEVIVDITVTIVDAIVVSSRLSLVASEIAISEMWVVDEEIIP